MNYEECMQYLDNINRNSGMIMGIEPVKTILQLLGNPEKTVRNIHIAGTNGKGSVSTFIAYILSEMGYKVGRYVSPTVDGYTERIQKLSDGKKEYISTEEVSRYISIIKEVSGQCMTGDRQLTQFEIETAMAYMAFSDWKCDYVILECGLGGKYDATNAVENKEICVFTPVSKDHTSVLGNSLQEIAENKAGILVNGVKAVSAKQKPDVKNTFDKCAEANDTIIGYCDEPYNIEYGIHGTEFDLNEEKYSISLPGTFQPYNAALAIKTVRTLFEDRDISKTLIGRALKKAVWPRRFEIISERPYVLVDGAHNVDGINALVDSINTLFPENEYQRTGIMGVFADKDVEGMIRGIEGVFLDIHTVQAPGPRGMKADDLADRIKNIIGENALAHTDMSAGQIVQKLLSEYYGAENNKKVIVIFGSLSLYY